MTFQRYQSRKEAGVRVANYIMKNHEELRNQIIRSPETFFCFAIPNGGVPVAEGFCQVLNLKYDILIVRKIKIPWNTEAGYGSITTDGTILVNDPLFNSLGLSERQHQKAISQTEIEIENRLNFYDKKSVSDQEYSKKIKNKSIFMIDDGLASGFTMLAAIKMIKTYDPKKIYIAVPTAPLNTTKKFNGKVEQIFSPNIRNIYRFAVAEAYLNWYDLTESEVKEILRSSNHYVELRDK